MSFDTAKDIPDLSNKTFLVTGGKSRTNGLGKETITALAKHSPQYIYFTGRNADGAKSLIDNVKSTAPSSKLTFIKCDQLSLDSVKAAAKEFLSASCQLDVLICNAGVMATEPALTKDGYENQFGVNHMAHALLVKLLLPTLRKTADKTGDARILFLTSLGFMYPLPVGIVFDGVKTTQDFGPGSQWARYGQSKLANVIYPAELARRYPSITSVSLHPGVVNTDIIGRLKPDEKELVYQSSKVIVEPHEGICNTCWCATTKQSGIKNGELYLPVGQLGEHSKESSDLKLAETLWTWTEMELEQYNL